MCAEREEVRRPVSTCEEGGLLSSLSDLATMATQRALTSPCLAAVHSPADPALATAAAGKVATAEGKRGRAARRLQHHHRSRCASSWSTSSHHCLPWSVARMPCLRLADHDERALASPSSPLPSTSPATESPAPRAYFSPSAFSPRSQWQPQALS